jgi:hypothetical protein
MANQLQYPGVSEPEEEEGQGSGGQDSSPYDGQGAAGNSSDPRGQGSNSPVSNGPYSPGNEQEQDYSQPDLGPGHNQPSLNPSDPRGQGGQGLGRDGLRQAEAGGANAGGLAPRFGDPGSESPEELSELEDEPDDQFANDFESDQNQRGSRRRRATTFARNNRSKLLIGGSLGGGGLISLFIALFSLIPLKVEHIIQNLESHFTAPVTSALEATNQIMLKKYIVRYVIPNYKNCGTTVTNKCRVRIVGGASNPVTNLYRSWAKTKLETRLATKYGIELHFDTGSRTWLLKGPGTAPDGDNIGAHGERIDNVFGRKAFKNASVNAMAVDSKWKQVWYRYIIGSYMGRVDGVKRCIFFCGTRESIRGTVDEMKQSAKYILADRVLQPRSQLTGVAVKCLLDPGCQPDHTTANGDNPPTSDFDQQTTTTLESLAAENGVEDMAKLKAIHAKMSERGFQKYLIDQILQTVFKQQTSERISNAIPVLGWINLAAEIVKNANNVGPKLKKISYVIEAAAAVKFFMTYQTYADEIHTGNVDANEVGSMVDSLGPGVNSSSDPLVGGTASAEQAPLYGDLVNGQPSTTVSTSYKCNNGKSPRPDTACPEEMLGGGNNIANSIHGFLAQPGVNVIVTIANAWNDTIGAIFNFASSVSGDVMSLVGKAAETAIEVGCTKIPTPFGDVYPIAGSVLPGVGDALCRVKDAALAAAPKIIEGLVNYVIPNPWGTNQGGGRSLTLLAQGAKVYGDTGCDQAGCKDVSGPVASAIIKQQEEEDRQQFESQPFFARMFSTDSSYSLVSQLAMATPLNLHASMQTGFASLLGDPMSAFTHSFGTVFSFGRAGAAATPNADPFGDGAKAFPTRNIPPDPETYWNTHNCGDTSDNGPIAKWQKAAADGPVSPKTGEPVHRTVEPCLLIQTDVGAVGGKDDSSLLTADDLAGVNGTGGTPAPPATPPVGTPAPPGSVVFPFPAKVSVVPPSSWSKDQGVDISTGGSACGKDAPEVAMADGVIVGRGISGFGPDAPILHITDGSLKDRYIYYGHAGDAQNSNGAGRPPNTNVGDKVTVGQTITYTGCGIVGLSSGPHLEIGIWPQGSSPSNSFPAMNQTSDEMMQILLTAYKAQGSK